MVTAILPQSTGNFQSSIILSKVVWQLYLGLKPGENFENIGAKKEDICPQETFSKTLDIAVRTLTGL